MRVDPILTSRERRPQPPELHASALSIIEELARQQGVELRPSREIFDSYPRGTDEEEERFYQAILDHCVAEP